MATANHLPAAPRFRHTHEFYETLRPATALLRGVVLHCGDSSPDHVPHQSCRYKDDLMHSCYCKQGLGGSMYQQDISDRFFEHEGEALFARPGLCFCRMTICDIVGLRTRSISPKRLALCFEIVAPEINGAEPFFTAWQQLDASGCVEDIPIFSELGFYGTFQDPTGITERTWRLMCIDDAEEQPLLTPVWRRLLRHQHQHQEHAFYKHRTCHLCLGDRVASANQNKRRMLRRKTQIDTWLPGDLELCPQRSSIRRISIDEKKKK